MGRPCPAPALQCMARQVFSLPAGPAPQLAAACCLPALASSSSSAAHGGRPGHGHTRPQHGCNALSRYLLTSAAQHPEGNFGTFLAGSHRHSVSWRNSARSIKPGSCSSSARCWEQLAASATAHSTSEFLTHHQKSWKKKKIKALITYCWANIP